tara:strand:+ start:1873 stop:2202 length:330 start_codon:yes stop_codon:yes gene_type:complete
MVKGKVAKKTGKKSGDLPKGKSERVESLWRILVAIVSGIVLEVWGYLVVLLAVANWIFTIFSGRRSRDLATFCEYWNTEMYKYFRYLTGVSNVRPFPFSSVEKMTEFGK